MDELVDILDANGNPTGEVCLKSEAHQKGLFHPTVHVWLYTKQGQVLFQQRGTHKDTFPSLWDVSVAGHIGAGENIQEAAVREVAEEIGLTIDPQQLEKIGLFKSMHRHSETLLDNEFHHTFLCELKMPLSELQRQESEVDALQLVELNVFKENIDLGKLKDFVPHEISYYQEIVNAISKKLEA